MSNLIGAPTSRCRPFARCLPSVAARVVYCLAMAGTSYIGSEPWCGVEPRHLATFVAVAETGSFRAAASRFGYVQSAVSQQIAHLERALGAQLIERAKAGRPLTLTAAGATLVGHAERIVQQVRAASADVASMTRDTPLRIVVEPAAARLVPGIVMRMTTPRPGTCVTVTEAPASRHAELLSACAADFAIGTATCKTGGLHRIVIQVDPWALLVAADLPLAACESLADLRGLALVVDRSQPLPVDPDELGMHVTAHCNRAALAVGFVRAGIGCALLPSLAADASEGVRVLALDRLVPPRPISVMWCRARQLSPYADVFTCDEQPTAVAA
jgi:DNA-binding transcriptional LysR family regulator